MGQRGRRSRSGTLGDAALTLRAVKLNGHAKDVDPLTVKRQMLAEFCRLVGTLNGSGVANDGRGGEAQGAATVPPRHADEISALPPRLRQTLVGLLQGDSEKQVAAKLRISPHTVHVYVKSLYRRIRGARRGELEARWVRPTVSAEDRT